MKKYGKVIKDANLKNYNTYKLDVKCKYLIEVDDYNSLKELINHLKEKEIKYFIIGNGSNLILPLYYDGVVIKLNLNDISIKDNIVEVGSSYMMGKLAFDSVKHSLKGLEWASSLPATVGGAVINNAGCFGGETFDSLVKIDCLYNGEIITLNKKDIDYGYRYTNLKDYIILKAYFKLEKGNKEELIKTIKEINDKRKKSQAIIYPSAGSVFKNPEGDYAGRLIQECGLKEKKIGGAMVSSEHANFIINYNNASTDDIINLINLIKEEVLKKFNIELVLEQEIK